MILERPERSPSASILLKKRSFSLPNRKKNPSRPLFFAFYFLPVFLYASLIFYLSSKPAPEEMPTFFLADKIAHIIEYGGFGFLMVRFLNALKVEKRASIFLSTLFCTAYGILDEFHQSYVSTRTFSYFDMIANFIGSFLGSMAYFRFVSLVGRIRMKMGKKVSE